MSYDEAMRIIIDAARDYLSDYESGVKEGYYDDHDDAQGNIARLTEALRTVAP